MSSSDSLPDSPKAPDEPVFAGITFHIHGQWAGWTEGKITRLIEQNGGKVSRNIENPSISHIILSEHLWSRQGTAGADPTIKCMIKANEENRTEDDEDYNRVWLLPIEWMIDSAHVGVRLPERALDLERTQDAVRQQRQIELAKERRRNGGVSKFGRGERQRYERERAMKAELARHDKLGPSSNNDPDAFAGLPQIAVPARPLPAILSVPAGGSVAPGSFTTAPGIPILSSPLSDVMMPGAFRGSTLALPNNVPVATADKSARESPLSAVKTSEEGLPKEQAGNLAVERSREEEDEDDDLYAQPKPAKLAQPKQMSIRERLDMLASGSKDATAAAGKSEPKEEKKETKASPGKANKGATSSASKLKKPSNEKKALQNGVKGELKVASGLAKKVEKAKSARDQYDQLAGKGRKSSGSSSAAAAAAPPKPATTGAIKSPTGIKSFADLRKPTGGMFAGGSRRVPETAASSSKISSPAAAAANVKKGDSGKNPRRDAKHAVANSENDSSDEEPLAKKVSKLCRGSQQEVKAGSSTAKPAFKIDAHGKKRARFVGDESDEDEPTRPLKKKKKNSTALPDLAISDSE